MSVSIFAYEIYFFTVTKYVLLVFIYFIL